MISRLKHVLRRLRSFLIRPVKIDTKLLDELRDEVVSEVGGVKGQLHAAEVFYQSVQDHLAMSGARVETVVNGLEAARREVRDARADMLAVLERIAPIAQARGLPDARIEDIDGPTADFLNYVGSHRGPLADVGLWRNEPVVVQWRAGDASIGAVNERILEQPFVLGHLGGLEPGASILDIGGGESLIGLMLAGLGHHVTVLEPAGYPYRHPNLTVREIALEDHDAEEGSVDAVVLLSAIEHFGIGAYADEEVLDEDADIAALTRVRKLLAPDGVLVLTTPFGPAAVNDLERTYDAERLGRLLEGFAVEELRIGSRLDDTTWQVTGAELTTPAAPGHVAMVRARPA